MNAANIAGAQVVVFGLGQHGGGVAAARWCVAQGAQVTVYDRKPAAALKDSIAQLRGLPITFQCDDDRPDRIRAADIVIKNPAVPRGSPHLREARRIESDLSLLVRRRLPPTIAVTGTKGKTSVVSAIAHALAQLGVTHAIAGNSGTSIFSIYDRLPAIDMLVLELSSFQLGDLAFVRNWNNDQQAIAAWPDVAVCTNLYPDHLDYYGSMTEYVADKCVIAQHQQATQWIILNGAPTQRSYTDTFINSGRAQVLLVAGDGDTSDAVSDDTRTAQRPLAGIARRHDDKYGSTVDIDLHGARSRYSLQTMAQGGATAYNLSVAYAALRCAGLLTPTTRPPPHRSAPALFAQWRGTAHRMEQIGESVHIRFINDSAATIPAAVSAAIAAIDTPLYLIAGGSDKGIDLRAFIDIAAAVTQLFLLAGSATVRIVALLRRHRQRYAGPFASLQSAFQALIAAIAADRQLPPVAAEPRQPRAARTSEQIRPTQAPKAVALLSPGCASFGMFAHEFDRGRQYCDLVTAYIQAETMSGR